MSLLAAVVVSLTCAQQAPGSVLPTLVRLGRPPAGAPTVTIATPAPAVPIEVPAAQPTIVVAADRAVRSGGLADVLAKAAAAGVRVVHFAATLPDGTPGSIALALPARADVVPTLTLRAHRERDGVPPESAVPLLQGLREGWQATDQAPFVLELTVPADASQQQVLQLLAAAVTAGVDCVLLRTAGATSAGAPAGGGALALDIGPTVQIQVPPREWPAGRPTLVDGPFGALEPPSADGVGEPRAGAGGRYGGRGGGPARALEAAGTLRRSLAWLAGQQTSDGSLGSDGTEQREATALYALALLGNGTHLDGGEQVDALRGAIGWLVSRQRDDGTFGEPGPGAVRADALATYALVEAYGLSSSGALLGAVTRRALARLVAQRQHDGGFADGTPGAASDAVSTATAACAVASATFFRLDGGATPVELVAWFDGHPQEAAEGAAAELFARYFAGQDPRQNARLAALADLLVQQADPADARAGYWTTFALFQTGGPHWKTWSQRLQGAIVATQITDGPFAGTWDSQGPASAQLLGTAYRALSLEAWFRYSRLVR